jgi:hypothetical protein
MDLTQPDLFPNYINFLLRNKTLPFTDKTESSVLVCFGFVLFCFLVVLRYELLQPCAHILTDVKSQGQQTFGAIYSMTQ